MSEKIIPIYIPCIQEKLLYGKRALITGGTSGIGYAVARAYLKCGASIIITGRNEEKLRNKKDELLKNTNKRSDAVDILKLDIASKSIEIENVLNTLKDVNVDILVNCAGILRGDIFGYTKGEDFDAILDTNLRGTYFVSQYISNQMIEKDIKGNLLMIASSSSLRPANSPYILSKWGIRALTVGLAKQLISNGIVVNGIAPGPTATPMLGIIESNSDLSLPQNPSKRLLTVEEIANFAVFLVSDMGRMIVGDILYMTGGAGTITVDDV